MNANQFRRWLAKQGCKFETRRGGSGHVTVVRGTRRSQLPMHSGSRELGRKLVEKILKDLEIK
jgi:mRNA interferase HicA